MTQSCTPLTFERAVRQVANFLNRTVAGDIVGLKRGMIDKWVNENNDANPTLRQALALDAAFNSAGGEGAPILEAYVAQIDVMLRNRTACRVAYAGELAEVAHECGEAIAAGVALTLPGASASAVQRAMIESEQALSSMTALMKRQKSFLPGGAGPFGESAGGVSA